MELLKIFPSLILDIISKVVPGALFLLVFQNRYLPPSELLLALFSVPDSLSTWRTWYEAGIVLCTAYFLGVFIAILGNLAESRAIQRHWYPRLRDKPGDYIYAGDQPAEMQAALASSVSFTLFIDHCRNYIYVNSPASAVMLEKYRTAYRLFFGLTLLFAVLPLGVRTLPSLLSLLAVPVCAALAWHLSRRYLCKSIQLYSFASAGTTTKT